MKSRKNLLIIIITLVVAVIAAATTITVVSVNNAGSHAAILSLAERYLDELNYEQAVIQFQRVIEVDPMNADAYEGLIKAYEAMGEFELAEMIRQRAFWETGDPRFENADLSEIPVGETEQEQALTRLIDNPDAEVSQRVLDSIRSIEIWGDKHILVNRSMYDIPTISDVIISLSGFTIYYDDDTQEDFSFGNISSLEFVKRLKNLESLKIEGNRISDVSPLASLTKLDSLWLDSNQITDVLPLSSIKTLTRLDLYNNNITDISPLSGLTGLTIMYLNENQISDITPLNGLTNLEYLNLYNNYLDQSQIDELQSKLPDCDIDF